MSADPRGNTPPSESSDSNVYLCYLCYVKIQTAARNASNNLASAFRHAWPLKTIPKWRRRSAGYQLLEISLFVVFGDFPGCRALLVFVDCC